MLTDAPLAGPFRVRRGTFGCAAPRPSVHSYSVLAFHLGGRVKVEHRGELEVEAGQVHVIPAGDAHRILAARGVEAWGLAVCATCLPRERSDLLAVFDRVRGGALPVIELPGDRQAHLLHLFEELAHEQERGLPLQGAVSESLLTLILAEVARAAPGHAAPKGEGALVAAALALIEARCLGELSLEQLAGELRRTPAHLTTAVRRATGRTVGEWIREGRLAEARRRLIATDEHIDVIAERVGYLDPRSFARLFRRHHGLGPAAFRKRERASRAAERSPLLEAR